MPTTKKMSEWQNCGTMYAILNGVAETTVDNTFRVIEAFNGSSGLNRVSVNLTNNTMTVTDAGTYAFIGTGKFDGTNKIFELSLFINGVDVGLTMSDRGSGDASLATTLSLNAGDVIDARQRSTDGGVALTVESMTLTIERLI